MVVILARRVMQAVLVLLLVALISFAIFRFVGNPVENILGQEATVQDRNEMIARMGLDDPIPVQYARFVWKALHFDFGISYRTAEPVAELIASRLPATLELALYRPCSPSSRASFWEFSRRLRAGGSWPGW